MLHRCDTEELLSYNTCVNKASHLIFIILIRDAAFGELDVTIRAILALLAFHRLIIEFILRLLFLLDSSFRRLDDSLSLLVQLATALGFRDHRSR